jgi:predicted DNA binding CopG/RHH family protein
MITKYEHKITRIETEKITYINKDKNINIEISHECWKKLKILSIHKDITLQQVVRDILESGSSKKKDIISIQE